MPPIRVLFLLGQTATGKGSVAFDLARRLDAEIVSLDSMKIYRGMDIGTNKPSPERRQAVPYHMLDLVDPWEHFSTALYAAGAHKAIAGIAARRRLPLVAGGTALYLKALTEGLFDGPAADPELRARIRREAAELGSPALHARLAGLDPTAAARIHPNDLRRIERALEVRELTGRPISELQTQFGRPGDRYDALLFGLRRDKADLRDRICRRVDAMMAAGLLDEIRRLAAGPNPLGKEASQAVGYKELLAHLHGEAMLDAAVELIKRRTRRLAKAQMTWFKQMKTIRWLDLAPDEPPDRTVARVIELAHGSSSPRSSICNL